jgi:multiple sugar transport system permease protein
VNSGFVYALGTAASWLGWGGLLYALYLVFRRAVPSAQSPPNLSSVGWTLAISAAGLAVAATLLPSNALRWRLPLFWVAMPFAAWAAALCGAFAIARALQARLEQNKLESAARRRAALIWLAAAAFFAWMFWRSGDQAQVLRGSIAVSSGALVALAAGYLAALSLMVATARSVQARGLARSAANHAALAVGSVVFGLPFAWLVITSFKEDADMASPKGLVWVPRVQEQAPHFDPEEIHVVGTYEGRRVEGIVAKRHPDGSATVEIWKPAVLRGLSFEAPPGYKPVPKLVDVVRGSLDGARVKGKVVKELGSGRVRVEVLDPASMRGRMFEADLEEVEKVRPIGLKVSNYSEALDYLPPETLRGLVYIKNTLVIVVLSVIGTLLSSSIVAYAFARMRFPGKSALFLVLLSTMMLPAAVTLLPTFLIFRSLGWIDTLRPLWVPAFLGSAFNIFLLQQFFKTIPLELEDAAKIDGCTHLRTFWQVMLPQVKPALAVVAIWTFLASWNNFMGPLIYINSPENMPISYALQLFQGDRLNEPGLLMAFATMSMLPVLLVFFFAQKYFIEGVTLSGLGGR